MPGLLALEPLLGARLDRGARRRQRLQPLLAPGQPVRNRHPGGNVRLIRRLGLGRKVGHLGFQLRPGLARVLMIPVAQPYTSRPSSTVGWQDAEPVRR